MECIRNRKSITVTIELKVATPEDYEYAEKFAYAAIETYDLLPQDSLDSEWIKEYILSFITPAQGKSALLSYENGFENPPSGAIGLEVVHNPLNKDVFLVEKFLWVEPEARSKGHGQELLNAATFIGTVLGCSQFQISRQETKDKKLNKALDKSYKECGFTLRDYNYVKELK